MEIKNAAWGKSMYVCIVLFLKFTCAAFPEIDIGTYYVPGR